MTKSNVLEFAVFQNGGCQGLAVGRKWEIAFLMGTKFPFCKMNRSVGMNSGDGGTTKWTYWTPLNGTHKIGRDSEFYVMYNLTTILTNKINVNNFYFYVVRPGELFCFFRFFSLSQFFYNKDICFHNQKNIN